MSTITITGTVGLLPAGSPISNAEVELWDSAGEYGRLYVTETNVEGRFTFTIFDPIKSLIEAEPVATIIPQYKVYLDGQLLADETITYVAAEEISIDISQSDYDNADISESILLVKGIVSDHRKMPIKDKTVNIYQAGFRQKFLLAKTTTDILGSYSIKINKKDLGNVTSTAKKSLRVEVVNMDDNDIIASSGDLFINQDVIIANLQTIEDYISSPIFDVIEEAILNVIEGADISSLEINDNTSLDELSYTAKSLGKKRDDILMLVHAHKYAAEASLDTKCMFALLSRSGDTGSAGNPVLRMKEQEMRDAIETAMGGKIIGEQAPHEIDEFITDAKAYQVTATKDTGVNNETFTINDLLLSIFANQTEVDDYLALSNNVEYTNLEEFWSEYESQHGSTLTAKAQKGLHIATITGYQPEITAYLLTTLGTDDLSSIATWDVSQWSSAISSVCTTHTTLCVPAVIRGDETDYTSTEVHNEYAKLLAGIVQNMYPLINIRAALEGVDGSLLISDSDTRDEVITFINNNPRFDLRISSITDIDDSENDLTDITDTDAIAEALAPFQRIIRLTIGNPEAVVTLIKDGLLSAKDISELSEDEFLESYSDILGGEDAAKTLYAKALSISELAKSYLINAMTSSGGSVASGVIPKMDFSGDTGGSTVAHPDLTTMFGNMDYCSCDQCSSMYSPTAYFTDILNYLRTTSPIAYAELLNRRPDIIHIDLTCKNANTALPYIDLVNELLELFVLEKVGVTLPAASFQTNGTSAQLAAYPQHVYKDSNDDYVDYPGYTRVYENDPSTTNGVLNNAIYPANLPFSFSIDETRSYLTYLGASRFEMMRLFKPFLPSAFTATNEITNYSIYAEMLGLAKNSADIINLAHSESSNTYKFYGFSSSTVTGWPDPVDSSAVLPTDDWYDVLASRVDVLLQQSEISYKELLQFLITDFLNLPHTTPTIHRDVNIVANSIATNEDTCKLNELKLEFNVDNNITKQEFFGKLYRFVRLYRTGRLSIYQWDILLKSFGIDELNATSKPTINGSSIDFELIGRSINLSKRLRISPEYLASWWSDINTTEYIDYSSGNRDKISSVYSSIFDNKQVLNNPSYNPLSDPSSVSLGALEYGDYTASIAAYCLINESELIDLLDFLNIDFSDNIQITELSRIYIIAQIAVANKYSVGEFITVLKLSDTLSAVGDFLLNPPDSSGSPTYTYSDYLAALEGLADVIDAIRSSGISVVEYNYLVGNIDDNRAYFQDSTRVRLFYEGLKEGLLKLELYVSPIEPEDIPAAQILLNQYINIIYQEFSKQFNIPSRWVRAMLDSDTVTTDTTISESFSMKIVQDTLFRNPDEESLQEGASGTDAYYLKYRQMHKVVYITNVLKIKTDDLTYIYNDGRSLSNPGGAINFNFEDLFSTVDDAYLPSPNPTPENEFYGLLRLSCLIEVRNRLKLKDGDLATYLSLSYSDADATINKQAWLDFFVQRTQWGSILTELTGVASDNQLPSAGSATNLLRSTFVNDADPALSHPSSFTPNSYSNISMLINVDKIALQCKLMGLTAYTLQKSLRPDVTLNDSQKIVLAAKGKQTDEGWQKVSKPLRDTIRKKQRDALVGYLLANPPVSNQYPWRNKNDLYAYLLIDVEMEPVMLTSRTKQAISTVQLFVDRAFLQLEFTNGNNTVSPIDITNNLGFKHQWKTWRKWYSIWAANRQIFMYPENWLVPNLRDDKTQFFDELQTELLQEEATEESVDKVMRNYLHKLDEVSYMEPVGVCDATDPITNEQITHAFARTYGNPQHYYYRKMIGDEWQGWQKMDIDIKSNHISPIVWNNRLYVFWITFIDKKVKAVKGTNASGGYDWLIQQSGGSNCMWFFNDPLSSGEEPDPNDPNSLYYHQLEISLNWTEYKDNKWEKQRIGKDSIKMNLNPYLSMDFNDLLDTSKGRNDNQGIIPYYSFLTNNLHESFISLTKARFYLYPQIPSDLLGRPSTNGLKVHLLFPTDWNNTLERGMFHMQTFEFPDPGLEPIVSRYTSSFLHHLAPIGTANKDMRFVEYQPWSNSGSKLYIDEYGGKAPSERYIYSREKKEVVSGFPTKTRSAAKVILNQIASIRGDFKILSKSNFQRNPLENQFFYTDDTNTFFVRAPYQATGMWIAAASSPTSSFTAGTGKGVSVGTLYGGGTIGVAPSTSASNGLTSAVTFNSGTLSFANAGPLEVTAVYNTTSAVSFEAAGPMTLVVSGVLNGTAVQAPIGGYSTPTNSGGTYTPYVPIGPVVVGPPGAATYYFQTFYHPHIQSFIRALYTGGMDRMLDIGVQKQNDTMGFASNYQPTSIVFNKDQYLYPKNDVDFSYMGAYSIYNWEIFFHVPLLIAQSLSNNQKFELAQKWYHYIFNPTNTKGIDGKTTSNLKSRFWNFYPFHVKSTTTIDSIDDLLLDVYNQNGPGLGQANKMQKYPFQPFVIARLREEAFMKHVVIKYVENLIAWGDSLFGRNTIESINEATQLYIMASNILGVKPQEVPKRAESANYSFDELLSTGKIDALGNARVAVENFIDYNAGLGLTTPRTNTSGAPVPMFYFCVPENKEMLKLWDTVADRLYKVRNSLNLKGLANTLPLFEPPVNPALLVQAAAGGVDINSVLDDISGASLPNYKFSYILQKANEYCNDVKALGGALLSALEKKDAEEIALLRSGLEYKVLDSTLQMKKTQLTETEANLEALLLSREVTEFKLNYYKNKEFNNAREKEHIKSLNETIELQRQQATMSAIASGMSLIPQFHLQATFAIGAQFGGQQLSTIFQAISTRLGFESGMKSTSANIASTVAGHERRWEDWQFQYESAEKELANIDQQIVASKIRIEVTEKDIQNQEIQIENNRVIDEYMHTKYTNKELYSWMITQISSTYFQAYQLAYQMAKKAGKCYDHELPFAKQSSTEFVKFGYWDSLKKGLLAGERLQLDLRKLENAYIDSNSRELELTKHVSIGMLNPDAILDLKLSGVCTFTIPNWLYNLDYPGHYNRRIKSVSITIPCVAGPYTTVAAELGLTSHKIYDETDTELFSGSSTESIATSSAQNDNGLFDFNFKDERYLPFEGRGAESTWSLNLVSDKELRQFDYNTISDVILHIKYTAQSGGKIADTVNDLKDIINATTHPLPRYTSIKHEFSNAWGAAFSGTVDNQNSNDVARLLSLNLRHDQFPYYCTGKIIKIKSVIFYAIPSYIGDGETYKIESWNDGIATGAPDETLTLSSATYMATTGNLDSAVTLGVNGDYTLNFKLFKIVDSTEVVVTEDEIKDMYAVINYQLEIPTP